MAQWLPVVIAPLPALAALFVLLAMFAPSLSSLSSEALDVLYAQGKDIGMALPARNELSEVLLSTVRLSPGLVYISVAIVFYFTERAYYRKPDSEACVIMPMPDLFIGLLLVSLLFLALPYAVGDNELISAIGMNGLIIVVALYFFRGLDIIRHYLVRLRLSPFLIAIVYVLLLIYWPMTIAVAVLGFASVYVNLIRDENEKKA